MTFRFTRADYIANQTAIQALCRRSPSLVPIVQRGRLSAVTSREIAAPDASLTVEDYVLGCEALGMPFHLIRRPDGGVALSSPITFFDLPPTWLRHGLNLMNAFRPADRSDEIGAYLRDRGDRIIGASEPDDEDELVRQAVEGVEAGVRADG